MKCFSLFPLWLHANRVEIPRCHSDRVLDIRWETRRRTLRLFWATKGVGVCRSKYERENLKIQKSCNGSTREVQNALWISNSQLRYYPHRDQSRDHSQPAYWYRSCIRKSYVFVVIGMVDHRGQFCIQCMSGCIEDSRGHYSKITTLDAIWWLSSWLFSTNVELNQVRPGLDAIMDLR